MSNKDEFERFFNLNTISDCADLLEIYAIFFIKVIKNHKKDHEAIIEESDAKLILQMITTRCLNLKNNLNGLNFVTENEIYLEGTIDPTIISLLIRNIYEMIGMFNLIFINPNSKDERRILYLLWVHAGLSYRQKFSSLVTVEENKKKLQDEVKEINDIKNEIEQNNKFKQLDAKNQGKIITKLKEKDYLIEFIGNDVNFLSWKDLVNTLHISKTVKEQIYTYLSLYTHPSNVSVFQFDKMFRGNNESREVIFFNIQLASCLLSVFIADYIKMHPKVLETFEKLPLKNQIIINFYNTLARGRNFDINDSLEKL
jgi:hypothetical protein